MTKTNRIRLDHWSLGFEYCPSTLLRVVSLSNHLLFGAWNLLNTDNQLYYFIHFNFYMVFVGPKTTRYLSEVCWPGNFPWLC